MKILFFGTPEFVVPIVEALHKTYNRGREKEFIGVVTQPPRPAGRTQQLEYSAVDTYAHAHKIPIYFELDDLPEADLGVCAAYGSIIPDKVLQQFPLGIINIHPSLLPRYRGASPIQATLANADTEGGVTLIKMDRDLDHGPIISQFTEEILETDTNETLRDRLFVRSAEFLIELLPAYIAGKIQLKEQDHESASFTKPILRDDGFIEGKYIALALQGVTHSETTAVRFMKDVSVTPNAEFVMNLLRAFTPWPGIYTTVIINDETKRLKLLEASIENEKLILTSVQLEGKNPVTWDQFQKGYPQFSFTK